MKINQIIVISVLCFSIITLAQEMAERNPIFYDILWAARHGDTNYFINNPDINLNVVNEYGVTPLMLAISIKNENGVKTLLDAGANPNLFSGTQITPLMLAALKGNENIVKVLINAGAYLSPTDKYGKTALDIAKEKGFYNIVKILKDEQENRKKVIQEFTEKVTQETNLLPELAEIVYEYAIRPK